MTLHFCVAQAEDGQRLDQYLSARAGDLSRTMIARFIKEGCVQVGGCTVQKAGYAVFAGDLIDADFSDPKPLDVAASDIPLEILYEDADVLVVNKPKGMVVHPAAGHTDDTLVNALLYHCGETLSGIGGVLRPGIVHRIDKDTTGALLVCKNDAAHQALSAQLKAHTTKRTYVAIVYGLVKEEDGTIDKSVGRSMHDRKKMAVTEDETKGKRAVTHYHVLKRFPDMRFTYLSLQLETGRTHQIRVHMAHAGHPLLGDSVYAPGRKSPFKDLEGQCLHAQSLTFTHPASGETIHVEAPLPAYFTHLLEVLH